MPLEYEGEMPDSTWGRLEKASLCLGKLEKPDSGLGKPEKNWVLKNAYVAASECRMAFN